MKSSIFYPAGEIYLCILVIFGICSCSTPHYMYAPTAVNVPTFTQGGESTAGISFSTRGVDVQAGYAISNHVAITGSWYWRHERQYDDSGHTTSLFPSGKKMDSVRYLRRLWSLGLTYFAAIDQKQHFYVMLTGGYGEGRFSMNEHSTTKDRNTGTALASNFYHYDAQMKRVYFQPAFMGKFSSVKVALSLRFSGMIYHDIHSGYTTNFNVKANKAYVFTEPALTLHITPPGSPWLTLKFQSGFVIPPATIPFRYRSFIGNIGAGVDIVRIFTKKAPVNQTLSLR